MIFGQANQNKDELKERPFVLGYEKGAPVRFAGEQIATNIGFDRGSFANQARDPQYANMFKEFVARMESGPFSLMAERQNEQRPNAPQEAA